MATGCGRDFIFRWWRFRQTDCGDLGLFDETAVVLIETTIVRLRRGTKSQGMDPLVLASLSERVWRLEYCILPFDPSKGPQVLAADARPKSAYRKPVRPPNSARPGLVVPVLGK